MILFFSPKDVEDRRRVLALQQEAFDLASTRRQLCVHVGDDDERVGKLDELAAELGLG